MLPPIRPVPSLCRPHTLCRTFTHPSQIHHVHQVAQFDTDDVSVAGPDESPIGNERLYRYKRRLAAMRVSDTDHATIVTAILERREGALPPSLTRLVKRYSTPPENASEDRAPPAFAKFVDLSDNHSYSVRIDPLQDQSATTQVERLPGSFNTLDFFVTLELFDQAASMENRQDLPPTKRSPVDPGAIVTLLGWEPLPRILQLFSVPEPFALSRGVQGVLVTLEANDLSVSERLEQFTEQIGICYGEKSILHSRIDSIVGLAERFGVAFLSGAVQACVIHDQMTLANALFFRIAHQRRPLQTSRLLEDMQQFLCQRDPCLHPESTILSSLYSAALLAYICIQKREGVELIIRKARRLQIRIPPTILADVKRFLSSNRPFRSPSKNTIPHSSAFVFKLSEIHPPATVPDIATVKTGSRSSAPQAILRFLVSSEASDFETAEALKAILLYSGKVIIPDEIYASACLHHINTVLAATKLSSSEAGVPRDIAEKLVPPIRSLGEWMEFVGNSVDGSAVIYAKLAEVYRAVSNLIKKHGANAHLMDQVRAAMISRPRLGSIWVMMELKEMRCGSSGSDVHLLAYAMRHLELEVCHNGIAAAIGAAVLEKGAEVAITSPSYSRTDSPSDAIRYPIPQRSHGLILRSILNLQRSPARLEQLWETFRNEIRQVVRPHRLPIYSPFFSNFCRLQGAARALRFLREMEMTETNIPRTTEFYVTLACQYALEDNEARAMFIMDHLDYYETYPNIQRFLEEDSCWPNVEDTLAGDESTPSGQTYVKNRNRPPVFLTPVGMARVLLAFCRTGRDYPVRDFQRRIMNHKDFPAYSKNRTVQRALQAAISLQSGGLAWMTPVPVSRIIG